MNTHFLWKEEIYQEIGLNDEKRDRDNLYISFSFILSTRIVFQVETFSGRIGRPEKRRKKSINA